MDNTADAGDYVYEEPDYKKFSDAIKEAIKIK